MLRMVEGAAAHVLRMVEGVAAHVHGCYRKADITLS